MTARMKRLAYPFLAHLALALLALGAPLAASAQTGTTGTTGTGTTTPTAAIQQGLVVKRDGKQLKNEPLVYVTKEHCDDNLEYEFSVKYTNSVPVTEVWVGVGTEDCSTVESRQRSTTTSTSAVCKLVGRAGASLTPKITVNAIELFSSGASSIDDGEETDDAGSDETDAGSELDAGVGDEEAGAEDAGTSLDTSVPPVGSTGSQGCDEVTSLNYRVFVIPLPQPTNEAGNKAYPPLAAASYGYSTLTATFTLYTELPDAPGNVRGEGGETELTTRFDQISGAMSLTTYRVYFDWGEADGQTCGSGVLVKDAKSPGEDVSITSVAASSGKAVLKDLDDKGIEINTQVAASVVTVDPAGNESLLSEPVCIERVETLSFKDRCAMDKNCELHTCSLQPGARGRGLLALSLLFGLAAALLVRRRHV
jgi:hypothetical protein